MKRINVYLGAIYHSEDNFAVYEIHENPNFIAIHAVAMIVRDETSRRRQDPSTSQPGWIVVKLTG